MIPDFLWTFAVQETLKKVLKVASDQIGLAWGFEEHLSKLQIWLLKGEAFLCDINTRTLHHHSVRIWVNQLQHLVYQADNLLDEIVYEHLRQTVQTSTMKKVRNFVSPSNNAFIFRRNMANKMKTLIELLEKHYIEAAPLGLVGNESARGEIDVIDQFRETISELDDYEIVGRDVEVESIVKQVVDATNQKVTCILPIVGMGGLGKTSVAKLVFNHEMIKQHFDKTLWVCVSEPFVVNRILGEILQNLNGISNGGDSKEVLLHQLQEKMHGQRYFLVLDDVWNENAFLWDELKYCLLRITGNCENCIVVTTRSVDVAKIMETHPSHHLSKLNDDQCWSLFKESANACGVSMTSNLEIVRNELVKKIGGVPLVARVLGRAVKFEGDDERWVEMLESVLRSPLEEENFVLSILKLSVNHLPSSSIKQCFAYCSNFPKDCLIEKETLVRMWMAQGFLQPQKGRKNTTMENVGDIYFKTLLSRCLFQDVLRDEQGIIRHCMMHDLVHDIACAISSDQILQLNPSNMSKKAKDQKRLSEKVARKLYTVDFVSKIPHNVEQRVFDVKIKNFVCLRVLKIDISPFDKLPESIGQLKHLRYLEIIFINVTRWSEISSYAKRKFLKSIVFLYNLQTLKFQLFRLIEDFPEKLANLVSLRHLTFGGAGVRKTPPHLSQLTQLQTLSHFVVGFEKGCKITELGALKNLQGRLHLSGLQKVESKEEAKRAYLVENENLNELVLSWSFGRKHNRPNDSEVLEELQPHKNLKSLEIDNFAGNLLPNKIFVENLRSICLSSSKNCEKLPMLGQLNNLKELKIYHFHGVRIIGNEFYGNYDSNQKTFFPKLEIFLLYYVINLEKWEEIITNDASSNVTIFPNLRCLEIVKCPKLIKIPDVFGDCDENGVQHLEELTISECFKLTRLPNGLHFCGSTQTVKVNHNSSNLSISLGNKLKLSLSIGPLDKLPEELCQLMNLRRIKIIGCMHNYDLSLLQHLPSLKFVCLADVDHEFRSNVSTQFPQQLQLLTSLERLSIEHFGGIEALPEWFGNFVSLQALSVSNCENLKQLPSTEAMLRLTNLSELYVWECPQLLLGEGDSERAKLSRLPKIKIHLNSYLTL